MKSAGLPKIEMAGRNLSVPYAPPGAKRIDDDDKLKFKNSAFDPAFLFLLSHST